MELSISVLVGTFDTMSLVGTLTIFGYAASEDEDWLDSIGYWTLV